MMMVVVVVMSLLHLVNSNLLSWTGDSLTM